MGKKTNHILDAISSITKAQQELEEHVSRNEKIIESQGQNIAELEKQVLALRNKSIQAEVSNGERSDAVARKYGLSPSCIAQIAPRKKFHRPKPN
jgi:Mg2+ and Co2+ transporter CorA